MENIQTRKRFGLFIRLNNGYGFSLISVLISLAFLFMALPILHHLTVLIINNPSAYEALSIHQLFIILRNDLLEATEVSIQQPSTLILKLPNGREALYEQLQSNFVRRLDSGFEVYLRGIKFIHFESLSYGLHTTIVTLSGDEYEKTITFLE